MWELFVDLSGDVALGAADDLFLGAVFGGSSGDVGAGAVAVGHAHEGDTPQGSVGVAVAASVEAIALVLP